MASLTQPLLSKNAPSVALEITCSSREKYATVLEQAKKVAKTVLESPKKTASQWIRRILTRDGGYIEAERYAHEVHIRGISPKGESMHVTFVKSQGEIIDLVFKTTFIIDNPDLESQLKKLKS